MGPKCSTVLDTKTEWRALIDNLTPRDMKYRLFVGWVSITILRPHAAHYGVESLVHYNHSRQEKDQAISALNCATMSRCMSMYGGNSPFV